MIEEDLKTCLNEISTTYCGAIPQGKPLPAIAYQVYAREEGMYQGGFNASTLTHFRLSIYDTYPLAKALTKSVKTAIQASGWKWLHEGEWDVFQTRDDGTDDYFSHVAMNIAIWSNET